MTNLYAERTKSPYYRCYAMRAFLNIMAPNFKIFFVYRYVLIWVITQYNLQVDAQDSSCVLSTKELLR